MGRACTVCLVVVAVGWGAVVRAERLRDVSGASSFAVPGAWVECVFQGTGIRWLGQRFDDAGLAEIRIDGQVAAEVDQ